METPPDAAARWEAEMELRPLGGGDGVVLYVEEEGGAAAEGEGGGGDFLSVAIIKG